MSHRQSFLRVHFSYCRCIFKQKLSPWYQSGKLGQRVNWLLCNCVLWEVGQTANKKGRMYAKPQGSASIYSFEVKSCSNGNKPNEGENKSIWGPAGRFMSKRCKLGLILSHFINCQIPKKLTKIKSTQTTRSCTMWRSWKEQEVKGKR